MNENTELEPTADGRWIARLGLGLDIEEIGDTEHEARLRVVATMMSMMRAMPDEEADAWFDANTTFDPNPPFDAKACAIAYREANPFPIEGLA